MRKIGFSTAMLLASTAMPAWALQTQAAPPRATTPTPAPGQAAPADEEADAGPDVVVNGSRLPAGSVVGDIPPEQVLGPADIRSYGVSSLNDLLTELSPETRSDRGSGGAPVVLLNGKRISSFAEIRDIPTEAIARVDILPEEVALKYGYRADQRVVNIVLRQRFQAVTAEATGGVVTDGGRANERGQLDVLKIRNGARANLDLNYQHSDRILESDRDIVSRSTGSTSPTTGITDLRPYRTLSPATQTFSANAVYARPIGKVSASLNARVQLDSTAVEQGLPSISYTVPATNPFAPGGQATAVRRYVDSANPLGLDTQTLAAHVGLGLNGDISPKWRWTVTANYDRTEANTFGDTGLDPGALQARINANDPNVDPFGRLDPRLLAAYPANRGYSTQNIAGADALINGQPFKLPAGNVSIAARVGAQSNGFDSRAVRTFIDRTTGVATGTDQSVSLTRNVVNGQLNVDVPLTSRRTKFLDAIGDLSINGNIAADHLSDFGTLWTYGYGFNWSPTPSLRIITSVTDQDQAPTQQQLGNPVISTFNVPVFDYVTGQSVSVTTVSGGNLGLVASDRHVLKVGATFKPSATKDWTFIANFVKTGTDNPIENFPAVTAAVAAAFPGRFTRDGNGTLTQIDARPINFAREDTQELRYGFNISFPIKSKIQKEIEAFRAGKGPNPFSGLREAFGNRQSVFGGSAGGGGRGGQGGQQGQGGTPPGAAPTQPDGSAMNGGTPNNGSGGYGGRGFGGRGGGRGGFGGGGFGGGRGGGGGRIQFAAYHTIHFVDRVTLKDGLPPIDLLHGGATGNGGGQPRHELEAQAGYANNGLGFRLSENWQSATHVDGGSFASPTALRFGALSRLNLRIFDDFTQNLDFIKKHKWAAGVRVSLNISNVFDARQRVTDQNGIVPPNYAGAYLDPIGRTVSIGIRKLIF